MMPMDMYRLLREGTPQFVDGDEQKIRNVLLEILNRLPNNEVFYFISSHALQLAHYFSH
jgi:hypothetical protein